MKHIKILSLIILLAFNLNAQWFRQAPTVGFGNIEKIVFIDENIGWSIGSSHFSKTTNRGLTWSIEPILIWPSSEVDDILFFDNDTGIFSSGKSIFRTTNAGLSWSINQEIEYSNRILFSSINDSTVFSVDNNGRSFISTDKGETWDEKVNINLNAIDYVCFINDSIGIILGGNKIYRTVNLGLVWEAIDTVLDSYLNSVTFTDEFTGYIVGSGGKILKTSDAGLSWDYLSSGVSGNLNSVYFINNQTGFAVGDSSIILKTTNAGVTWLTKNQPQSWQSLLTISFIDNNNGFAGGISGWLFSTTNGGETWVLESKYREADQLYDVDFYNNKMGVAVGLSGTIEVTRDGGNSWLQLPIDPSKHWNEVTVLDTNNIIIVGKKILKSSDCGLTWYQTSDYSGHSISKIEGQNIFVLSGNTDILKSSDNGEHWVEQSTNLYGNYYDINFIDANIGYIIGDSGNVFKTTNGGLSWTNRSINENCQLIRAKFFNENTGIAIGQGIYKTTDGGLNWISNLNFTNYYLLDVDFGDNNNGFAVGYSQPFRGVGVILRTTDGGDNWNEVFETSFEAFMGISLVDVNNIWVAGNMGILHTTNTGITFIDEDENYSSNISSFQLQQNFPNPFNPNTQINYTVTQNSFVTLKVYDILGKEITTLVNEEKHAGSYQIDFNASALPSGVYFYKLQTGSFTETKKMVLMK